LVLGHLYSLEEDRGVMHLVWNGSEWSAPTRIYASSDPPEWPRIDVGAGNRVYATWFTRDERHIEDPERGRYRIWVSSYQASAPPQAPGPLPTLSPTPTLDVQGQITPTPATTPIPVAALDGSGLPPGLYTEGDDIARLILALSPIAVVLLIVISLRFGWLRRR
jgi:hypothetical protein